MTKLSARLEALAEKATKGPYRLVANGTGVAGKKGSGVILFAKERFMCRAERNANAEVAYELMANLPTILQALKDKDL